MMYLKLFYVVWRQPHATLHFYQLNARPILPRFIACPQNKNKTKKKSNTNNNNNNYSEQHITNNLTVWLRFEHISNRACVRSVLWLCLYTSPSLSHTRSLARSLFLSVDPLCWLLAKNKQSTDDTQCLPATKTISTRNFSLTSHC